MPCGTIRTEINIQRYKSTAPEDRALQHAVLRRVPLGFGEPEDIAAAVAFLSSAMAARGVIGVMLSVDGGYSADGAARL